MILERNNFRAKFSLENGYLAALLVLFCLQAILWRSVSNIRATIEVVPPPPNEKMLKALTFGDDEFYYRTRYFRVQNMGDTFGRFTSLALYDYSRLYDWFKILSKLNGESVYLASLAAYYFSQTPKVSDKIHMVNYLADYTSENTEKRWWWLYQAVYIAFYGMKDRRLGIKLAYDLNEAAPDTAPLWTKQMVGILLSENGDDCEAIRVIGEILRDFETNSSKSSEEKEREIDYMKTFITSKLRQLKKKQASVDDCINKGSEKWK